MRGPRIIAEGCGLCGAKSAGVILFRRGGLEAVEFRDECGGAAGEVADLFAEFLPVFVDEDKCGEAISFILLLQFRILLFDFLAELFLIREIDFHEDEILRGVIGEFFLAEGLLDHLDAPAAPVGAGEIEEHGFVLGFGLGDGLFVVIQPRGSGGGLGFHGTERAGERSEECGGGDGDE